VALDQLEHGLDPVERDRLADVVDLAREGVDLLVGLLGPRLRLGRLVGLVVEIGLEL
jgi:hypothetical protein